LGLPIVLPGGKVALIDDGEMTVVLKNCKFKRGFEELRAGDQQLQKTVMRDARTSPVQISWMTGGHQQGSLSKHWRLGSLWNGSSVPDALEEIDRRKGLHSFKGRAPISEV
jgi:hypothetical protein